MYYVIGWRRPRSRSNVSQADFARWDLLNGPFRSVSIAQRYGENAMMMEMTGHMDDEWELVEYEVVRRGQLRAYGLAVSQYEQQALPGLRETR